MEKNKAKNNNQIDEDDDDRIPCKYGYKCYQKNPEHHKKYWHPPKKINPEDEKKGDSNAGKKRKTPENPESTVDESPRAKKQNLSDETVNDSNEKLDSKEKPKSDENEPSESTKSEKDENEENEAPEGVKNQTVTNDHDEEIENAEEETTMSTEDNDKETAKSIKKTEKETTKSTEDAEEETTKDIEDNVEKTTKSREDADEEIAMETENTEEKTTENTENDKEETTKDTEHDEVETIKDTDNTEIKTTKNIQNTLKKTTKNVENTVNKTTKNTENTEKKTAINTKNVEKKTDDGYVEAKKLIQKTFLFAMPDDFYKFYDLCKEIKPNDPSMAFKIADLKLVGPYDVLNGLITKQTSNQNKLVIHWRYYYDPPEFQTIVKGNDKEGLHFGYWRDRPSSDPCFVATNCSNVSHKIKPVAENIFGAIANYLEERIKKASPFEKTSLFNLLAKIKAYAKKHNITLEAQTAKMKSREKNVVARTIHGAGIVCPYNKKSQVGYRELSVSDNQLLKIIKKIDDAKDDESRQQARSELEEVVRLATIAGDECDFGTCLELGHDLLSTGCVYVQNAALAVLNIAYTQLERQAFLKIVEAHMENRKKGCNLSVLSNTDSKIST